jgi:type III secretion protein J
MLLAACTTTLEQGLDEPQADAIVAALGEHGIGATKEADRGGGGFRVIVGESDVAVSLAVLRDEGLPRADTPGMAETFAEPSLVPTAGEERARTSAALAADLARSIEAMPGVHDARVHVGMPDPSVVPMDARGETPVASVLVRRESRASVDEAGVRALVAGAVPGLTAERVTVVVTERPADAADAPGPVAVGPFYVTAGSAPALRLALAALLAMNVALVGAIAFLIRRKR